MHTGTGTGGRSGSGLPRAKWYSSHSTSVARSWSPSVAVQIATPNGCVVSAFALSLAWLGGCAGNVQTGNASVAKLRKRMT